MCLSVYLVVCGYLVACAAVKQVYEVPPRIEVQDGHLVITSAEHKNIKFQTTGDGSVRINGADMSKAAETMASAVNAMNKYQTDFESTFEKISRFEQIFDNNDGLVQKILQSNSSAGPSTSSNVVTVRIRRLSRRVATLQRQVSNLVALLTRDECVSNPCNNGGTCQDIFDGFMCTCAKGWEGSSCEKDVNECANFAGTDLGCQNGATCLNRQGTYECVCAPLWFGIHCTKRSADCNSGSSLELCGHGYCVSQNNEVGYKCVCDQGWTTDGKTQACNTDVNECTASKPPCSTNPLVPCENLPGSFFCGRCPEGYTGNGFYCTDINECAGGNNGGCSPMVQCINTIGSRICGNCPPGYVGDGVSCSFEGVCRVNNGGCHPLATCRENPRISATFVECTCPRGYTGNGLGPNGCVVSAFAANPCGSNPCQHGSCVANNVTGDYTCVCGARYSGRNCETLIDPCASNPCLNGGTCNALFGSFYRCLCKNQYTGSRCQDEMQACGGRIRRENGTLVYPSLTSVNYDHSASCAWTIETNATKVLNLTFSRFNIENSRICQYDWLQIHDGKNTAAHSLGRFCGNKLPNGGNIISTHNVIYMWFRSDHSVANTGFALNWTSIDPVCGGLINVESHGTIQSPGAPNGNYPNNRDCYWTLSAPASKRLLFHFFTLFIGNNPNCDQDYVEFIAGYSPTDEVFAKFCNTSHPAPLHSPGSEVMVHFHSDDSKNYPGFQASYQVVEGIPGCGGMYNQEHADIHSPSFEGKYPPDVMCEYKIKLSPKSRIKLTFLSFKLEDSENCNFDNVAVYAGPNTDSPLIGRYCGSTVPGPYISNSNELTIVFKTDWTVALDGFVIRYETVCGGVFTGSTGIIESPNYPSNYIKSQSCIYEISQPLGKSIKLDILDLDMEFNSACMYDYLEIRDGDNENATLIGKYCEKKPPTIISTFNYLWLKFASDMSVTGKGFQANYTVMDVGCGGILKDRIGTVSSPQYPDVYPATTCRWIISAPPGFVVQIVWMNFHLEQSSNCVYDSLTVFDNNTETNVGSQVGKYCGHALPPTLLSSSNVLTLIFYADTTVNTGGFLASYTFVEESTVCGGNFYTSIGNIKTPNFPNPYPPNIECFWTIRVESGHQIMLNVTSFDLEFYNDCRYDFLEIRNGPSAVSPLMGKYCGTKIPPLLPSHTNAVYLHFKSDMTKVAPGFKITWDATTTGCGGSLNAPTGSITSPNYPEPYNVNTECVWKISVSAGSKIQIAFADLDLEVQNNCIADYIELFDGPSLNSRSLGKYCSSTHTQFIESTSNHMVIKFESDLSESGRGFQLKYSTMCNHTVTGFRGVIESPNFPNGYPHNLNCNWNINVSAQNKINLTFSHFELESQSPSYSSNQSGNCIYDYVEIKYGKMDEYVESVDYSKYGSYCGDQKPPPITLDSDMGQIHFVSDSFVAGDGFRLEWQIEGIEEVILSLKVSEMAENALLYIPYPGCGGILTRPEGSIVSPNYPKSYPPSVECIWQIQVDYGNSIVLTFKELDIEKDSSCDYDHIKIYNGEDNTYPEIARICHQEKPTTLTSSGNSMYIHFRADTSYEGKGFYANYSSQTTKCGGKYTADQGRIMSPNYPNNFDRNDTCGWLIEIPDGYVVEVVFETVDLEETEGVSCAQNNNSFVKVHDGPSAAYPVLAKACGRDSPNDTYVSTHNQVFIEMVSDNQLPSKGFTAKYSKGCGARIVTSGTGTIKINSLSLQYEKENCTWTIISEDPNNHISLTVTHLDTQNAYFEEVNPLRIYNGETADAPLLGSYSGTKIPPMLTSDGSAMHVHVDVGINFFATYSVFESACGGTLTSIDGYFASPGYPKYYPDDIECEWTLNIAVGNHVSLNFIEFNLLESDNCNTDYLEIRQNSSSGKLLGAFCGGDLPSNITHAGSLWILLKTAKISMNTAITARGFYAEYSLNQDNELTGPSGTIQSPLYPQSYTAYGEFSWMITVDFGKRVQLTFKDFYFDIYTDSSCEFSFSSHLEVFDGSDADANSLGNFCGINVPDPIKSTSNIVFIKVYYTTVKFHAKFELEWLQVENKIVSPLPPHLKPIKCGAGDTPTDLTGVNNFTKIESPGYPNGYSANLRCEWIFTTIPMNHLFIRFDFVDFERQYSLVSTCYLDYVEVFQKTELDTEWQSVRKVCYDNYTIVHTTNLMRVVFHSNAYNNGTGFSANVREVCGGSMSTESGVIFFDNTTFYNSYSSPNYCQWNVTAKPGRTIEVTFLQMNIYHDTSQGCNNYIILRNGLTSTSPMLGNGKYCGTELPPPLKTTGNELSVKLSGAWNIAGFKLSYRSVSYACGGEKTLSVFEKSTEIKSPNYPNVPPAHIECIWVIMGPPGETLRIDFEGRFDITSSGGCKKGAVELRDGGTESSPVIARHCDKLPSSSFTTDNLMFIKFFTDIDDPGSGFSANISIAKCGGTIRGVKGDIASPFFNRPKQYPVNYNCTWRIITPTDHTIDLKFTKLGLLDGDNDDCSSVDHVTISEKNAATGDVTILGTFCGESIPDKITSSSNEVSVQFQTGSTSHELNGFALKFNASTETCGGIIRSSNGIIMSPGYPVQHQIYRYCNWKIHVPAGRRVTLEILDLDVDQRTSTRQAMGMAFFNDEQFKSSITYIRPSGVPPKVVESSQNFMMVYYWAQGGNKRGFKARFSSNEPSVCDGDFGDDNGILNQPQNSSVPYRCTYIRSKPSDVSATLAMSIRATFNTTSTYKMFNCDYPSGFIKVTKDDKKALATLCIANPGPLVVRSPFPTTQILTSQTILYTVNYTISYKKHPCGGIITNTEMGTITSPGYPSAYSNTKSIECAWLLTLPSEQAIKVTINNLNLGSNCVLSYLDVFNGDLPTTPKIARFCQNNIGEHKIITSQTNNLWIEYKADKDSDGTGFSLSYEPVINGCGGIFHDRERVIQSPSFPNQYPNNAECVWEIRSQEGYHIGLKFLTRFQIEESDNCNNDFVEVWDWKEDSWVSLGKKCGRDLPPAMNSTSNRMKIMFRSNNEITAAGFRAEWDWNCGGVFKTDLKERFITSPGFPVGYQSNMVCMYNITGPPGQFISLKFLDFNLEGSTPNCKFDNLTISNFGALQTSHWNHGRQNVYCGLNKPPEVRLVSTIYVTFRSDPYVVRPGFRFSYQLESCGGNVTSPSEIVSPQLNMARIPSVFYGYITCVWKITAPPKKQIEVEFTTFQLAFRSECYFDNVEIFEGNFTTTDKRLANLCGNLDSSLPVVRSKGNSVVIRLKSDRTGRYKGFRANINFVDGPEAGCGGILNATKAAQTITAPNLQNMFCTWDIIAPAGLNVKIHLKELHLAPSCKIGNHSLTGCRCNSLQIKDGGSPISETIEELCSVEVTDTGAELYTYVTSGTTAMIRLKTSGSITKAFQLTYAAVESICGPAYLNATDEVKTLTSPNYPSTYPSNIRCAWQIRATMNKIDLHFTDFDLIEDRGQHYTTNICARDKVLVVDDPSSKIISEGLGPRTVISGSRRETTEFLAYNPVYGTHQFCGKAELPFDYYSTREYLLVKFVSGSSDQDRGKGFKLQYQQVGCNRNYTSSQGRIVMQKAKDCTTLITVAENATISLFFQSFMVQTTPNCDQVGVEIYDGSSQTGKSVMRICGWAIPNPVFSSGNKLYMRFWNKRPVGYTSQYDLVYTSSDQGRGCGGTLFNYKGRFTSPLYPIEYKKSDPCEWNVRVPTGMRVALQFSVFDIAGECSENYVEVITYDKTTSSEHKFCKDDNPATLYSTAQLKVTYQSSSLNTGRGWLAQFEAVDSALEKL